MVTKEAVRNEREAEGRKEPGAPTCRHHWKIDAAEARTSQGECLLCQARREFPNYLSDCLIDGDEEKFEEWLARQGRRKSKKGGELGLPL